VPKLLKRVWRSLRQNCDVCRANSTLRRRGAFYSLAGLKTGVAYGQVSGLREKGP
jgi:hypothetical protein